MKWSIVVLTVVAAVLCVANMVSGDKPATEPGQQEMVARYTDAAPVIDGVMGPGEYSAAIPVHVKFNQYDMWPGVITGLGETLQYDLPNQDDLSFTIYTLYDDEYLYVTVDVADDAIWDDGYDYLGICPFCDDAPEIFVDADYADEGCTLMPDGSCEWNQSEEGFQIIMDSGGDPFAANDIVWDGAPGPRPRGYVVEFRIALTSIDMIDGEGEENPGPGDDIGFNVAVGDDDNGGWPYNVEQFWWGEPGELTDTYGRWDSSETFAESE